MPIRLRHRFYIKILFFFWFICAVLLVTVSFIAGQLTFHSWMSPRERIVINSYASILVNTLTDINNPQKNLCQLNKKLGHTLYLVASNKKHIYCKEPPKQLSEIAKKNMKHAFIYQNYLVSNALEVKNLSYWLVSSRQTLLNNPSFNIDYLKQHSGQKLLITLLLSAILCFLIAKSLTRPLKIISEKMSQFGKGNLEARVGHLLKKNKDEFSDIATEFDSMANNIKHLIKSKQQMLFNISHELRSPLARQLMCLDLLKVTPATEHEELLDDVEKENLLLNELITEVLMLAKLTSKTFSYHPVKQNISSLIKQSIKNINFEFQTSVICFKGANNLFAKVDKKLLSILIDNLLKNAVKYSGIEKKIVLLASGDNYHCQDRKSVV